MHLKHKAAALAAAFALAAAGGARAVPSNPLSLRPPPGTQHARQGLVASPDYCDPFSDWDDDADGSGGSNGGDDSSTNDLRAGASFPSRRGRSSLLGAGRRASGAAQVIGTTPEEIDRRFLRVVTANLANAGTATRIARLSDKELAAIGARATLGSSADRAALLKLFATRLDAKSLVRVARAFGRDAVGSAVRAYASPGVGAAFATASMGLVPPPPEGGGGGGSYPRPNLNMTLQEIYLEFRTAPVGSLSPSASLAETAGYAGGWLYASWKVGNWLGDGLYFLISTYTPGLNDAIGGTLTNMVENMWEASSDVQEGHYEAAIDELLGFPVTNSSDPSGDWDVTAAMVEYFMWEGICGY